MQIIQNSSTTNKNFTRVANVKIPDIYFRKFKTNIPDLDEAFGSEGFLPGAVITLAAPAGVGKSSIALQLLQTLEDTGKKTAYISGEETIEQLSFAAKRLKANSVPIANLCYIEDIEEAVCTHGFEFIVIDSYPTIMTKRTDLKARERESYVIGQLIRLAKEREVCMLIIMHFTKSGNFKGSTEITHAADALFTLEKNPDDHGLRDLIAHKNRFGACTFTTFPFGSEGYTFEATIADNKTKEKKQTKSDAILDALSTPKTQQQLTIETKTSGLYLASLIRQFIAEDKVIKDGRGPLATFVKKS